MNREYDLAIIGAGSGGLVAAGFAARLGARVALIEKARVGGDCTWTGCVPSKALIKAARIAHAVRTAAQYGIATPPPEIGMATVREYVRGAIGKVYQSETPEELRKQGIDVIQGHARFVDAHTLAAGGDTIRARFFLITTGARPAVPPIEGLGGVPFLTYEQIFDNDRLPRRLLVIGGGPVGVELAQAYQRLGSQVTVIAPRLLPKEEPEACDRIERVLAQEGVRIVPGRATAARREGAEIVITAGTGEVRGDQLLLAAGRAPNVSGLNLEAAQVRYSEKGIAVDDQLRTNVKHIYAAGDAAGGHQFTHFAGWQAFHAVRNALLPGHSSGFTEVVPRVTFTDPEIAQAGLTESEARAKFGDRIRIHAWEMTRTDRAICENDEVGFIKMIVADDGTVLGATVVAGRGGETIAELVLAIQHKLKIEDLAGVIHAYPTYSTAIQQLASGMAVDNLLSGTSGRLLLGLSKIIR